MAQYTPQRPPFRNAGPPGNRPSAESNHTMPPPQPVTYFKNGVLDPKWLDEQAMSTARDLKDVKTTQLRRFYEDVLGFKRRLALEGPQAFEAMRAEFKMLKAKAAYANGRDAPQFPKQFLQFFVNHVSAVNSEAEFQAFAKHFEAVVAFHRFFREEKD